MTAAKKRRAARAPTLTVPAGAETNVAIGEPILPHGMSWTVRCRIEDVPAVTQHLLLLAQECEASWRLRREQMPMADGVPSGVLEVPEDEWDPNQRRPRRVGF